jgi:salicylate hydroxylase
MASSPKLEIAICGAGIAGLTAAIALLKHPCIKVNIYDQATELREIGASIALGPNGLRTLQRLGLDNVISDEIGYRGPSKIPMIYKHWKTNEILGEDHHQAVTEHLHRTARYYRPHLQEALLEHVPRDIIHLGKKFKSAETSDESVQIAFEDGEQVHADILLGADGLRSVSGAYLFPLPGALNSLARVHQQDTYIATCRAFENF